jgi:site-specific recombinase XerD
LSLRQWFGWCAERGIDPLEATRSQIEIFARELESTGRTLATVASKLNALAGYYRYAVIDEVLDRDPMLNVRRPRVERVSTTQGLTRTEFADVLRVVETMPPRDHALICLLGLNGLRVSETCALDIDDLGHHKGQRTAYLSRKGGKVQTIPMSHRTAWAVSSAIGDRTSGPVLLTRSGVRLERRGAARIVARAARRAGITKHITPHSLRHTFVTMALDAGQAERDIAISTGHSDTRMVAYYDRGRDNISRNSTHAVSAWVEGAI